MKPHHRLGLFALSAMLGLGACSSDMQDLRSYVDEVKARPGGRIEPLPEIKPTPTFVYQAEERGGTLALHSRHAAGAG